MGTLLLGVFGASLLGSAHCAGMCGPFAVLAGDRASTRAAYHGARMAAYVVLGALAGALGAGLDLGGAAFGLQRVTLRIAAATLVLAGAWMLLRPLLGGRLGLAPPRRLREAVARVTRFAARRRPATRAALQGAATALLPCGWLYAFVVAAAGSGSAARGALVLLAFFLGSVPLLLLVAVGARRLAEPLRRLTPAAGAVALLLLGAVALGGRLSVPALNTAGAAGDVGEAVRSIDQDALPCCGAETSRDADH